MTHQIIDVSSNNPHPINWTEVKASGIEAVLIKATEGTGYTNPDYRTDRDGARAAGLLVAAYHFAHFDDPAVEARHFRSVAGGDAKALDVETSGDAAWIDAFLADLGEPSQEEMTYGSASTIPTTGITRGLLWSAAWGAIAPQEGEELWQYTNAGQVPGIEGKVDRSVWLGTDSQYQAFFQGHIAPVPQPPAPSPTPGPQPKPPKPSPSPHPEPTPAYPPFPGRLLLFPPETAGADVRMWQQRMQERGWHLTADGVYGPVSKGVCVAFQREKGLAVDGVVGPVTWDAAWTAPITRP